MTNAAIKEKIEEIIAEVMVNGSMGGWANRELLTLITQVRQETIEEYKKKIIKHNTDKMFGTVDFDGIAEDVLGLNDILRLKSLEK